MGPVITYVGELIQALGEVVLVVGRWVRVVMIRVIVSEDVVPALVASVVRILDGMSIFLRVDYRNLEILVHVDNYISVAKEFPGDHAALRGNLYSKIVVDYEGIVIGYAQSDLQILL